MKDIKMTQPVSVTLRAGDWAWVLGLLSAANNSGDFAVLDRMYDQIMNAIE